MDINAIALSALSAYQTKLGVTANNIANLYTDGFKPSEARIQDNAGQGVYVTISQSAIPEVDIAAEMISLMTARLGIEASLKSIKTVDEINRSILDILV